jgi:hypothetical protein
MIRRALPFLLAVLCIGGGALANPSGRKWSSLPVSYKVFNHTTGIKGVADFSNTVLPLVRSGFNRWTLNKVSCTRWNSTYAGLFTTPTGSAALSPQDGQNLVLWLGGAQWHNDNLTLGVTHVIYMPGSGQITDADIEFNNNVTWKAGGSGFATDIESIVTHEAGHFLGLDHTATTSAVMFASYNTGELKSTLQSADVNDVCTVYPTTSANGTQGDFCRVDTNCGTAAPKCRGLSGNPSSMICTVECSTDTQCPTGYTCQTASPAGATGKACLSRVGSPDLCKFCTDGSQCSSGICLGSGLNRFCSLTCTTAETCGPGYGCFPTNSSSICAPNTSKCPMPQCTSDAQCTLGFKCNTSNGMCEATGNIGDRCELSAFCKPCGVCIGSGAEAYCRPCCGGQGGGGSCTSCAATTCGSGSSCVTLSGSADRVCVPGGSQLCQSCDVSTACWPGLTCVAGRCHSPCTPANPGTCSACLSDGTDGVCACSDEVSTKDQPCGVQTNGSLKACQNGLLCVGQPKTCREQCTPGVPGSCDADHTCAAVEEKSVCVSHSTLGGQCGPCNGGSCGAGLSCVSGRCYAPCSIGSASACTSCVRTGTGSAGICACDDQRPGPGQGCGFVSNEPYSCQLGSFCIDGTCRKVCEPGLTVCPGEEVCTWVPPSYLCLLPGAVVSTDGGATPLRPDAGPQLSSTDAGDELPETTTGCGCTSLPPAALLWPALLGWAWVAQRRARRR